MTTSAHSQDYQEAAQSVQRLTQDEWAQLITEYAQRFDRDELIQVVAQLATMLAKQTAPQEQAQPQQQSEQRPKRRSILDYEGMAKDVWSDVNVEEYLKEERASWDKEVYGS